MDDSKKKRLQALDDKLKALEARKVKEDTQIGSAAKYNNMGLAYRMMIDLIAGVFFGIVIGMGIDRLIGTAPWGLVVMCLLGTAAGMKLMLQSAKKHEADREVNEVQNGGKS